MHHGRLMYNGVYTHYPPFPYHHHHHGMNFCSSCDIAEPLPMNNVHTYPPVYYPHYGWRRDVSCVDYLPPIVQTSVRNDIRYCYDDPGVIYDDEYGHAYRLSRSKVQLVDLVPRNRVRTYPNDMVVSTYRAREVPERIVIPRSTVVRHTSIPAYGTRKPVRVLPLYHSAPQYVMTSRI